MWQIITILLIITTAFVTCRGIDSLREQAEQVLSSDDSEKQERRQATERPRPAYGCGRVQLTIPTSPTFSEALEDEDDDLDKIIGGLYSVHGHVPWIANLMFHDIHVCAGAILNEFWIITAASCFDGADNRFASVVVGDNDLRSPDEDEQSFNLSGIYVHSFYSNLTKAHNLALLMVQSRNGTGIRFSDKVRPICLPSYWGTLNRTWITVAGWGFDSNYFLKRTNFPIEPESTCSMYGGGWMDLNGTICAGTFNDTFAMCLHDRGGPGYVTFSGVHYLLGVVSYTSVCYKPYLPSLLTSILYQLQWIQVIINYQSWNEWERFLPSPSPP